MSFGFLARVSRYGRSFLLLKLEQVVNREYVLVYLHSNFEANMCPSYKTLKNRFYILPPKFVYAKGGGVHPGCWAVVSACRGTPPHALKEDTSLCACCGACVVAAHALFVAC